MSKPLDFVQRYISHTDNILEKYRSRLFIKEAIYECFSQLKDNNLLVIIDLLNEEEKVHSYHAMKQS